MNGRIGDPRKSETFRYLAFGALTVALNAAAFKLLSVFMGSIAANTSAFCVAVLFAYWTNSRFVFRTGSAWKSFIKFAIMRLYTLPIDDGGMWLLLRLGVNDLLAKCTVNVIVILLNYLCSKFFIFRKEKRRA